MTAPDPIVIIVPYRNRPFQLNVPRSIAAWLRDELTAAIGRPKQRRRVRLSRGRWIERRR